MSDAANTCWHCAESLPAGEQLQATVAGQRHPVCCQGCRAAAEWIDQLGLADYYRLRSAPALRPAMTDAAERSRAAWQRPELTRHVVRELDGGHREVSLLIDGIRCSACVWLIERSLGSLTGIDSVQVNAGAQRARVVWDERLCSLPQILGALARTGYHALPLDATALDDLRRRETHTALKRLAVAGLGAMQAMMFASGLYLGAFDGIDLPTRDLLRWFGLLVATPVVFYAAQPFFSGALRSLRAYRLGMDVPVALAIMLIYVASVIEALRGGTEVYFDSVSMLVFFLLVGRYLEMRARHRAGDLADALARLTPLVAERIAEDGTLQRVGVVELRAGDRVHIAEGGVVPADGTLASERCRVDEALVSGESTPVIKQQGETLIAGSVMTEGPAELRVERVGSQTVLSGIVALVTHAATQRPRLAQAGERAAAGFVARVLTLAALTAIGWILVDPARAFAATLAVLVVSCPCAFALAVPAAITRSIAVLAKRGVLVVHSDAIEGLARATYIVFDKTGTLTNRKLLLERIDGWRDGIDREEALRLAATLARGSRHPVACAIAAAIPVMIGRAASELRAEAGGGLEGVIDGRRLRLGHTGFALRGAPAPAALADDAVVLADAEGVIASFSLREHLRPGAHAAIAALAASGLDLEIASGDASSKVSAVAAQLGITRWRARLSPVGKLARLEALRADGMRVIMVGDGINDAPVLAGADVAVALACGAELAQTSSDIVLAGERLDQLAEARAIARETLTILRQNQRWALVYNLTAMPFAALGLVPPWLAAIGMSASSLIVVLNALRIGNRSVAAAATSTLQEVEA